MDRIYRIRNGADGRYAVERDGTMYWLEGDIFGDYRPGAAVTEKALRFLAPVKPSKIVANALNYKDHAGEMNKPLTEEPLMFLNTTTAVSGPGAPVRMPPGVGRVHHDSEPWRDQRL